MVLPLDVETIHHNRGIGDEEHGDTEVQRKPLCNHSLLGIGHADHLCYDHGHRHLPQAQERLIQHVGENT